MACKAAKFNGEFHECDVTGDRCFWLYPDSKACAEEFGEGPDAMDGGDIEETPCGQ